MDVLFIVIAALDHLRQSINLRFSGIAHGAGKKYTEVKMIKVQIISMEPEAREAYAFINSENMFNARVDYSFAFEMLESMHDYSTKSNCIRGIHRAMRRLGILQYHIFNENGERIMRDRQG